MAVQFPVTAKGDRSTTAFGKDLVIAGARALGEAVAKEKDWRHKYHAHMYKLSEAQVRLAHTDPAKAMAALKATLDAATAMTFTPEGGEEKPLREAMAKAPAAPLAVASIEGSGQPQELTFPVEGTPLGLDGLEPYLQKWVASGNMEADAAEAIRSGAKGDLRGRTFLVLGASSELGPLELLLQLGATVAAVMRGGAAKWAKLIALARSSGGKLLVPVPAGTGGSDEAIAAAAG